MGEPGPGGGELAELHSVRAAFAEASAPNDRAAARLQEARLSSRIQGGHKGMVRAMGLVDEALGYARAVRGTAQEEVFQEAEELMAHMVDHAIGHQDRFQTSCRGSGIGAVPERAAKQMLILWEARGLVDPRIGSLQGVVPPHQSFVAVQSEPARWFLLGSVLELTGDEQGAVEAYLKHLEAGGRYNFVFHRLVDAIPEATADPEILFETLVALLPEVPVDELDEFLAGLSAAWDRMGRPEALPVKFREARDRERASAGDLIFLWHMQQAENRDELLAELAEELPGHPYVLRALIQAGDWEVVLEWAERAIERYFTGWSPGAEHGGHGSTGTSYDTVIHRPDLFDAVVRAWQETGVLEDELAGLQRRAGNGDSGSLGRVLAAQRLGLFSDLHVYVRSLDVAMSKADAEADRYAISCFLAQACASQGKQDILEDLARDTWARGPMTEPVVGLLHSLPDVSNAPPADVNTRMFVEMLAMSMAAAGGDQAVRDMGARVQAAPEDAFAHCLYVLVMQHAGAQQEWIVAGLADFLERYPRSTWAQLALLEEFAKAGDADALEAFGERLVRELPPAEAAQLCRLVSEYLLLRLDRPSDAVRWALNVYDHVSAVSADQAFYTRGFAEILAEAGQTVGASKLLDELLDASPFSLLASERQEVRRRIEELSAAADGPAEAPSGQDQGDTGVNGEAE